MIPQHKGYILISVVLTLTILATLSLMLSRQGAINAGGVVREHHPDTARYAAEAGYNHAIWKLNQLNCSGYTDISSTGFGNQNYNTTITDSNGAPLTSGSPANITSTGTHATGISHTLTRSLEKIYQFPALQIVDQPDPTSGKDTYLYEWKNTWNYGADQNLWVENRYANSIANSLLEFDLDYITNNAKIISATLSLYQNTPSLAGGTVNVHRMTGLWVEGIKMGGIGAPNWTESDSSVSWSTIGGDYHSSVIASSNITAGSVDWFHWDITSLVAGWIAGHYLNYGMVLVPKEFGTATHFHSSDFTNSTLRPKLTITYTCECGKTCSTIPTDKIILSTSTAATLASLNFELTDLAEYDPVNNTATLNFDGSTTSFTSDIDALHVLENNNLILSSKDNASVAGLNFKDGDLVEYDPVLNIARLYFDESKFSTDEDIKSVHIMDNGHILLSTASNASLGGLSFTANDLVEYDLNTDTAALYFDGSAASFTGEIDAVHVLDNNHIILSTQLDSSLGGLNFKDGDLVEYNPITDAATLYFDESLFVDDENVQSVHIGEGSGIGLPDLLPPIAHWKLDESSGITAVDSAGGHDGTLVNGPVWSAGTIDGGLAFDGVDDYISAPHDNALSLTSALTLSAWINLKDTSGFSMIMVKGDSAGEPENYWLGIDNGQVNFGFDNGGYIQFTSTSLNILAGNWYHIAATFDDATDTVYLYKDGVYETFTTTSTPVSNSQSILLGNSQLANEQWGGLLDDIRIYNRVLNTSEITSLANNNSASPPTPSAKNCNGNFRDEFNLRTYGNSDGTLAWATDWLEVGEFDGPTSGDIQVRADQSNYQLRTRDNNNAGEGVEREANLSGAGSATLSYDYRRMNLDSSNDYTAVEISANGTAGPWVELSRHQGATNDSNYISVTPHDISSYISTNTRIRFKTSSTMGNTDIVWFDNIEIQCSP